jgi:OmpA-OmpF porin, OOP family
MQFESIFISGALSRRRTRVGGRISGGAAPSHARPIMTRLSFVALTSLLLLLPPRAARADWLDKAAKSAERKVQQRIDQRTNQAIDKAVNKAEETVRCAAGDQACIDRAKRAGKPYVVDGQKAAAPAQGAAAAAQGTAPAATDAARPASAAGAGAQPQLKLLKADFLPGERVLFYDDFSDMSAEDAPPHFKVRGAAPELRAGGGIRQLTVTRRGTLTPNLTGLPKNFTFDTELQADTKAGRADTNLILLSKGKQVLHWWVSISSGGTLDVTVSLRAPYSELGRARTKVNLADTVKVALWVQNGRMRSFVNGEKLLDFNQVELPPIDSVELDNGILGKAWFGFRSVRFAESTPDFSQVLATTGRYVTHGILFDTDSDRVRPESAAAVKLVASALKADPVLALLIEGHTDGSGAAEHNLDLSRRRAEAVKAILVTQFGVDAARLSAAGLGQSKPIDTNDTPQGRAQNRRVEFVKQAPKA